MTASPNDPTGRCERFTTDSYVHAHDLGTVPCIYCGRKYQEHSDGVDELIDRLPAHLRNAVIGAMGSDTDLQAMAAKLQADSDAAIANALANAPVTEWSTAEPPYGPSGWVLIQSDKLDSRAGRGVGALIGAGCLIGALLGVCVLAAALGVAVLWALASG